MRAEKTRTDDGSKTRKTAMISSSKKTSLAKQRKFLAAEVAKLREETQDLMDTIALLEARARNLDKPRIPHAVIMEKYGVK